MKIAPRYISIAICSIFCLLTNTHTKAQTYLTMAHENAQWIVQLDLDETPWHVDEMWEYRIMGDSSVNSTLYKKVYQRDLVTSQDQPPFAADGDFRLFGLIRDDVEEKKVFAIRFANTAGLNECPMEEEYTLYDFSMETGSNWQSCMYAYGEGLITEITTAETPFGIESKTFTIDQEYKLYEGIGSDFGLFEAIFVPVKSSREYLTQTHLAFYSREGDDNLVSVHNTEPDSPSFRIYPNPVQNQTFIQVNSTANISSLRISDICGKTIQTNPVDHKAGNIFQVDIGTLKNGIYFLSILDQNGKVLGSRKFVVVE